MLDNKDNKTTWEAIQKQSDSIGQHQENQENSTRTLDRARNDDQNDENQTARMPTGTP